jgi:hypothetical protein
VRGGALATLLLAALGWATPADALDRLPAVIHLHSDLTTGDFPLDALARMAEEQGIEALLLSENYLLRLEYGLAPFRSLTRVSRDERSVLDVGIDRYLAGLDEVRRAHPRVLIVPGVEVVPHYYWTGSPVVLSLELHNTQKNVLVFGLSPEALRGLPVTGNRSEPRYGTQSVLDAAPALLLVPGLVLVLRRRLRRRRLGRAVVVVRRRSWLAGGVLIAIAVVTLVRGWPFRLDAYPPWQDFGAAPYQALIDHVDRLGGATVWSFPEAPDLGEEHVGPVRVQFETKPYPDDLLKTFRYTAFGALYEQATRVADPAGIWDRLLVQYVVGERSRPAWALAESGFHGLTSGKRLGALQTVFLTADRTEAGVLDALRRGRLYAVQRTRETGLVLTDFSVSAGEASAGSGDVLPVAPGTVMDIRVAVESSDGSAQPVRVTLLRNGALAEAWAGQTPFRTTHRSTFNGAPIYFRVDVRGRPPQRLLTSPIFVVTS